MAVIETQAGFRIIWRLKCPYCNHDLACGYPLIEIRPEMRMQIISLSIAKRYSAAHFLTY